ncbi:MAG: conserved rane protein of unknown function [Flavipsychrobacter sp.]|nr:conserved rane protein of unknown function [Flavipsychrobacter sp.]
MNPDQLTELKEESLRWILSILGALLVYLVVTLITLQVYHPDIDHLHKVAEQVLAETWNVRPEPMEAMLFRLGVVAIIPSLLGFYILLSKTKLPVSLTGKWPFLFITSFFVLLVAVMIIAGFLAQNTSDDTSRIAAVGSDGQSDTNFQFYFNSFFLDKFFWIYVPVIAPLACCLFFIVLKKDKWTGLKKIAMPAQIAGYAIIGGTLLCILLMNTFSFPYSVENRYDFAAVYYSMTQVFAGSPMLVDGFTNTYGLYPHFLVPIFKLTGLSVFSFALTMSLLQVCSFIMNLYVLKKFTRNNVLLFAGFTTLLFFGYLNRKLQNHFDNYFALFPIRYIIPSILLLLATRYLSAPSKRLYYIIYFVQACFILWNPEIGIICYLAWILMNIYRDFYNSTGKANIKVIVMHVVTGVGIALIIAYSFKLIIWLSYGAAPDLGLLFSTVSVFSAVGFGLLPMDLLHPWNLLALIIVTGFMYAIAKWYGKQATPKACIVLLLSVISLGYFFYFQGRSHNSHLSSSMTFSILLLTILGDELWTIVKRSNEVLFSGLFILFLFLLSFSSIELLYSAPRSMAQVYQEEDKNSYADIIESIAAGKDLVERTSQEYEKIIVIAQKKHQPLFFDGNKRISAFNPGILDLFLLTDVRRLEQIITDSSFSIYLEATAESYPFMFRPLAAMGATYEYKAFANTTVWLTKRTTAIPGKTFFEHRDSVIIHRKYNDDKVGIQQRINDAMGIAPVRLSKQFSIEALFYTSSQMFPEATIVGNATDSSGFAIGKVFNSPQYFFVLNGKGFVAPFTPNTWNYVVMNISPGRADIYQNGVRLPTEVFNKQLLFNEQVRPSQASLCVGNILELERARFFVGPIAEINLANHTIDSAEVLTTWKRICDAVKN